LSLLAYNSTPAERARYCSFAERAESSWHVAENGGVISGTPIINFGATLDGVNDYLTYTLQGQEFNSDQWGLLFDFTPAFTPNDGSTYYLFEASLGGDSLVNIGTTGTLGVRLGGTVLFLTAWASYENYWNTLARNVLVVTGDGTLGADRSQVYLNGTEIDSGGAAWSKILHTSMTIGAQVGGADKAPTVFHQVKIFKSVLTADDALNYYNYGVA
jgi:hypothetical protein